MNDWPCLVYSHFRDVYSNVRCLLCLCLSAASGRHMFGTAMPLILLTLDVLYHISAFV